MSAFATDGELGLSLGKFEATAIGVQQTLSVRNFGDIRYKIIEVECGFFRGNTLLDSGIGFIKNLDPQSSGYVSVVSFVAKDSTRADCRIADAH